MTPSQDTAAGAPSRPRLRGHPWLLLASCLIVFAFDQASKLVAVTFHLGALAQNNSHPVHWWWVLPIFGLVAAFATTNSVRAEKWHSTGLR